MGKSGRKNGFQTRAVHAGQDVDHESGAIRRPIVMANSYALPDDPAELENLSWSGFDQNIYTRNGGANQKYLEAKIADLEEGEDCVVLASGVAALHALFFTVLKTGDHAVVSDNTYIAVYRQLHELFPAKYGIEATLVDSTDPENVRAAMRPNTKIVHIETPANPSMKITDIEACAGIAHGAGALLTVDNTFASPYDQIPFRFGADAVVESMTKFINGHGDSLGGAVIGRTEHLDEIRKVAQINIGGVISPFAAWLIMRGAATLPVRMARHNESALRIAQWLAARPGVSFVSYPGLPQHPGHEIAARQMTRGFGGMIAFGLAEGGKDALNRYVSRLRIVKNAVSLGHDMSLIAAIGPDDERQHLYPDACRGGFLRFSVGLEDAEDIMEDLGQAF